MWNLLAFALVGLLAGAAARVFCSGQQPMSVLGTILLGMAGALAGGMFSWTYWPQVDGELQPGNIVLAVFGAMSALLFGAGVAYARGFSPVSTKRP